MILISVLMISAALVSGASDKSAVTIKKATVEVTNRSFDPNRKPSDMPPLHGQEAAVTESQFSMETRAGAKVLSQEETIRGYEAEVQIESIEYRPKLRITIWLPDEAAKRLVDHENGHRKISELFYARLDDAALKYGATVIGKRYQGRGNGFDGAQRDAIHKAIEEANSPVMKHVEDVASKAQERFDAITDHGRKNVDVESAIERSIRDADDGAR